MKAAYIQSIGGASGDMLLGALLDLGLPLDTLREELARLDIDGYELSAAPDTRCEVRGTKLTVTINGNRRLSPRAQLDIIAASLLAEQVKQQSTKVLNSLWQAESRVHGEAPEALELEELGTVDTLVDVVGFAIGLQHLGIGEVYAAPLVLGAATPPRWPGGYANPAPATLELAAMAGAPIAPELPIHQGAGELTTPTGAAIITALARFERPAMSVAAIGVGLGSKDPEQFPNVVRVWLGELAESPASLSPDSAHDELVEPCQTPSGHCPAGNGDVRFWATPRSGCLTWARWTYGIRPDEEEPAWRNPVGIAAPNPGNRRRGVNPAGDANPGGAQPPGAAVRGGARSRGNGNRPGDSASQGKVPGRGGGSRRPGV